MFFKKLTAAVLLAGVVSLAAGCRKEANPAAKAATETRTNLQVFQVKGVVEELQPGEKTVVIKHEKIPNYMEAMTMPFEVRDVKELSGLHPGDEVSFRMLVTEKDGWIDRITKTGKTFVKTDEPQSGTDGPIPQPLKIGDPLPDYSFTNELGRVVRFSEFRGQALAFTLIFTRCPFPEFCPRMSRNFAEAAERISSRSNAPTNWHLFSISFDPEFDTPTVLSNYARRYEHDPGHWSFLTGEAGQIGELGRRLGLVVKKEGGSLSHNLRTVVVDTTGHIRQVYTHNGWGSDELAVETLKATVALDAPTAIPTTR